MGVKIRPFNEADVPYKVKWINDSDNNRFLHYDLPLQEDKTLEWFKSLAGRKDRADYTILYDSVPAGIIGLLNIDSINKKAEYYICLGGKEFGGKGIADRATDLLIKEAYHKFDMQKIYLFTEAENIGAQKLFERIGFEKEGLLKNDLIYMGTRINRYVYGLNVEEYLSRVSEGK